MANEKYLVRVYYWDDVNGDNMQERLNHFASEGYSVVSISGMKCMDMENEDAIVVVLEKK